MGDLTTHASKVVETFNAGDWDAMRDLVGDSTYNEVGTQRSLEGADAIIEAMQGWKAAMPDVTGTVTGALEDGSRVVLEVTWGGSQTGELVTEQGTIPASGRRQTTPAAFVFEYDDGRLSESRHYFDMLAFMKQIGAL